MKNKVKLLLSILLFCLCFCPYDSIAQTSNCTTEQLDGARQSLQAEAKTACANISSLATTFNSAAQSFISGCSSNLSPTPTKPSQETLSLASQAGVNLNNADLYQYRGVQFEIADKVSNSGCEDKMQKVKETKEAYESALRQCTSKLNATSQNSLSQCSCSDASREPECHAVDPKTDKVENQNSICYPFTTYLNLLNKCPLCPIFEVILNTNADVAHIAWEAAAEPLRTTVGIFFLVLLAFEVLKAVAAVGGIKPSALMKGVLLLCLKFSITIALLSNSSYIYKMFISPVIQGGLDMGLTIAQSGGGTGVNCDGAVGSITSQEFDPQLFNHVMCTIKGFTETASTMPAIGMGMVCYAYHSLSIKLFLCGMIMLLFGILIWLAFSFYLIDATVQLGMLGALVPLLIACWPFKMTQQYTTKGVRMLMNSFFTYTLAGVLMLLGSKVMLAAMSPSGGVTTDDFINAINSNNGKALQAIVSLDGLSILMLIACGIFAMKLIANLNGLSGQFASGSGMQAGAKIGTMAASAGKSIAGGAAHVGGVVGGHVAGAAADKLAQTKAGQKIQAFKGGAQKAWAGGWSKAGKAVGLGKFQNKNAGSGATGQGTAQEQGRAALPNNQQPQNPPQPPPNP